MPLRELAAERSDAMDFALANLRAEIDRTILIRKSGRLEAYTDAFDRLERATRAVKSLRAPAPVVGCAS